MVFLTSSSAQPVLVCSGGEVEILEEIDSSSPANFGGDGHTYWGAYFITPTSHVLDFTGTTGVQRMILFMRAESDIDAVERNWIGDLEYHGSMFGHATEIANADQDSRLNDLVGIWINDVVRSIDNITIDKEFYYATDPAQFDSSWVFINAEPVPFEPGGGAQSSIDWCQNAPGGDGTFVISGMVDAVATDFPGSCRVLAYVGGFRVRAMCEITPVE